MEKARSSYRALARVDAVLNRVYTSRYNPLYHSGALTVGLLLVLIVTGIYLLCFYRIGAPYESVAGLQRQVWGGRWIRGLHRVASDAALVAAAVHALRMWAQRRSWGPRALAWISGVFLFALFLVSGWTGYVLVWDAHAQLLAREGARVLDALPIFSEPIGRSFTGERELPSAFFFVNLFAHIALPLSVGGLLWVHIARLSRPVLLPPRRVLWGCILALTAAVIIWPLPLAAPADLLSQPRSVPIDWFYSFWLPVTQRLPAAVVWALALGSIALVTVVPWLTRPRTVALPAPAIVSERLCTGCEQCMHDCPYDAIEMIARSDARAGMVAHVRTELCTSCGICIGSCPPMAIAAAGASARDQLADVRAFIATQALGSSDVVIVGCTWSAAAETAAETGARLFPVNCAGTVHSSTVEHLLKGGAGGVLVVGCPEHDGRTREGVTWTQQRLFEGRKADLKARVDRARVRLVQANVGEHARLHRAVLDFSQEIDALADADVESIDILAMCRRQDEVV
jgi:coenzyme F420-reducing hydrogenase delta subunit/ferredoxin